MTESAISVRNLSKQYRIGARLERYRTFRELLARAVAAPFQRLIHLGRGSHKANDLIWALEDVSFEVQQGEVTGVIGRNGAGKSTLLKILCEITSPTKGRVELRGRVASLLEVGTGFHPELTGRENIFLNGAILGMRRAEIKRKFDEIVAFAEVDKFIDTPVKRYSSGMYVRLAFAVAAHLEPEILLVDEVLAVGDVEFQRKCLGKMKDVARGQGRTVIFVSHNMAAVRTLCTRAILLERGRVQASGASGEIIDLYLRSGQKQFGTELVFAEDEAPGNDRVKLTCVRIVGRNGAQVNCLNLDERFALELEFSVLEPLSNFHFVADVSSSDGTLLFRTASCDVADLAVMTQLKPGRYTACCEIPGHLLNRGTYLLSLNGQIPGKEILFTVENAVQWSMSEVGGAGDIRSVARPGLFRPLLNWTFAPATPRDSKKGAL